LHQKNLFIFFSLYHNRKSPISSYFIFFSKSNENLNNLFLQGKKKGEKNSMPSTKTKRSVKKKSASLFSESHERERNSYKSGIPPSAGGDPRPARHPGSSMRLQTQGICAKKSLAPLVGKEGLPPLRASSASASQTRP